MFCYLKGAEKCQNRIYDPKIKTLRVITNDNFENPPLLLLGSDQYLTISFDELSSDINWISYRIIHCNANWQPSRISELEYLDGFNEISLDDVTPSFNTFVPYHHYRLQIPNDKVQLRLSGNYMVQFYRDDNPQQVIASACFSVFEHNTEILASVSTNTDIDFNRQHQQVSLRLGWKNGMLSNPADELRVSVIQNNRPDSEVIVVNPTRFSANEAIYEHNRALIFEAGNNYRRFEITSHKYPGIGVEKISFFNPMYHVLLSNTAPKRKLPYYYDQDQNGRFIIRSVDAEDNDTESDYYTVHFTLEDENPFIEGEIHLNGDFTNNQFSEDTKMVYNFETQCYEKTMLLKQGHYNYQYLLVPNNGKKIAVGAIDGNFHETNNEYLIKVYYRPIGQRYDRLIGATRIETF